MTVEYAVLGQNSIRDSHYMLLLQLDALGQYVALVGVAVRLRSRCCTGVFASATLVGMPLRQASS